MSHLALLLMIAASPQDPAPEPQGHPVGAEEARRVEAEFVRGIGRVEAFFSQVVGSGTFREFNRPVQGPRGNRVPVPGAPETLRTSFVLDYWYRGELRKRVLRPRPPAPGAPASKSRILIECSGPRYSFWLHKSPEDGSLTIRGVGRGDDITEVFRRSVLEKTNGPFAVGGIAFSEVMADPSFGFKAVETLDGEPVRYKISYRFHPEGKLVYRDGWVVVRPDRNWSIQSFGLEADRPADGKRLTDYMRGETEYGPVQDGFALPTKTNILTMGMLRREFVFDAIRHEVLPDREFTLSAYGLPEPDAPAARPSRRPGASTPYFAAATASLAVALLLAWQAHRIGPRKPPEPIASLASGAGA